MRAASSRQPISLRSPRRAAKPARLSWVPAPSPPPAEPPAELLATGLLPPPPPTILCTASPGTPGPGDAGEIPDPLPAPRTLVTYPTGRRLRAGGLQGLLVPPLTPPARFTGPIPRPARINRPLAPARRRFLLCCAVQPPDPLGDRPRGAPTSRRGRPPAWPAAGPRPQARSASVASRRLRASCRGPSAAAPGGCGDGTSVREPPFPTHVSRLPNRPPREGPGRCLPPTCSRCRAGGRPWRGGRSSNPPFASPAGRRLSGPASPHPSPRTAHARAGPWSTVSGGGSDSECSIPHRRH